MSGSNKLKQSKRPFPTKGIFLPNPDGWEFPKSCSKPPTSTHIFWARSGTHASSGVGFGIFGHLGYTVCCQEDLIPRKMHFP